MASRTLKDRIGSLLNDPTTTDVTFVVGEEQVHFPAHSVVMSTASDPFKEMFFGNFNRERVVEIPDASPDGFRALIKFIYMDEADLTDDNLASVLSLADKYLVTDLFDLCVQHVTIANVCRFLALAEIYRDLSERCWNVVLNNGDEVLSSEYFLDLPRELFVKVQASDDLQVDEKTVFNRAIEWAMRRLEHEGHSYEPSTLRAALGDALYLIRFPLFDVNDFADGPFASGILTDKECFSLLLWFLTRKGHLLFTTKARLRTDAVAGVDRRRQYDCDDQTQDNVDLCANCHSTRAQNKGEHQNPTENIGSLIGVDTSESADTSDSSEDSVRRFNESLEHACQCRDANCRRHTCHKVKKVVQHMKLCRKREQTSDSCPVCTQLMALCRYHAKHCDLDECPVPFCFIPRQKLQKQERLLGLLREKCDATRASCGHPGVHWICFACYEPCCEIPECESSLNAHNDRTQHAVHFNASSTFCGQCCLPIASK